MKAEMERQLQRRKINAEDELRIRAAQLEAALLQQNIDGQSSSGGSQVGEKPFTRFAVNSPIRPSQSGLAYKSSALVFAPVMQQDVKQSGTSIS